MGGPQKIATTLPMQYKYTVSNAIYTQRCECNINPTLQMQCKSSIVNQGIKAALQVQCNTELKDIVQSLLIRMESYKLNL